MQRFYPSATLVAAHCSKLEALRFVPDLPSAELGPVVAPQRNIVEHMRALPHREVAAALAAVRASRKQPVDKLACEFLVLTAARSGEVRGAR